MAFPAGYARYTCTVVARVFWIVSVVSLDCFRVVYNALSTVCRLIQQSNTCHGKSNSKYGQCVVKIEL